MQIVHVLKDGRIVESVEGMRVIVPSDLIKPLKKERRSQNHKKENEHG